MNAKKLARARYDAWRRAILETEPVAFVPEWKSLTTRAKNMHVRVMQAAVRECEGK